MMMKYRFLPLTLLLFICMYGFAQQPGDTLVVSAFKYGSTSRDTMIVFTGSALSFGKIILKYNMRCKNALVSTQAAPDQGCGEWDYSCNTFIVDSSRIEEVPYTHPSHIIPGFSGSTFHYVNTPLFDHYRYRQIAVSLDSVISETLTPIGSGTTPVNGVLKTDERSGRGLILWTAQELLAAGFTAGAIDGMMLQVANAGGTAGFLSLCLRHDTLLALSSHNTALTGFSNVFNHHFQFVNGANRIQFHTPFVWDGVSNLILDLSFTNSTPGSLVQLLGTVTPQVSVLAAHNGYALNLSNQGLVRIDSTHFSTIGNQITMSFWAFGDASQLPGNTSILYGWSNNPGQRQLNLHLPWNNGIVYFDAGFSGTYDRISKTALPHEYKGQWNHWTFTKNATTGNMSIYLNGTLWHSGTGMTRPVTLLNLLLGNNHSGTSNYKGKIRELSLWDKALPAAEIGAWFNTPITNQHPSYSHLVAYYPMNEGAGSQLGDAKYQVTSSGTDIGWTYERGHRLQGVFTESTLRPNITWLRGTYLLDTTGVYVWDSVQRNPVNIKAYAVTPAPAGVIQDDAITLLNTIAAYSASPLIYTDGDADTLLYTQNIVANDSVVITQLPYFRRFPWYNEIMSFVTPYGKGLDLGVNGKTWYFDVTDFAPLLKGPKRLMMTGGIWQEDMDIDFWFIVGTPPQDVLDFNQLWQGSARAGQASIAAINNNTRYAVVSAPLLSNGTRFKVRSVITGHGAEGEFQQNGGVVTHYLSVNSTINDYAWSIHEECSFNPVFPQGGTWVYDRQGWCPGQYSLLKELDVTAKVTPGTTATFDYNCSPPQVSGGDYRYLIAKQLVTYGSPNHTLDAAILDIMAPTDVVVHSRKNPVCANPTILVKNTGTTAITALEVTYWLNQATNKQTYQWTGNLAFLDSAVIVLPTGTLWEHNLLTTGNVFHAELTKANGTTDEYPHNNSYRSGFNLSDQIPRTFVVEFKTNNYPTQNTYSIVDEAGNVVPGTSNLTAANTFYRDTLVLDGCYTLRVTDSGNDGLQWWANTAQGSGYVRLKRANGSLIKVFQADFGGGFEYSFSTFDPISIQEPDDLSAVVLYPNPATRKVYVLAGQNTISGIQVHDLTGRRMTEVLNPMNSSLELDVSGWPRGVYLVSIQTSSGRAVRKLMVE
jgi:hypothetical protein